MTGFRTAVGIQIVASCAAAGAVGWPGTASAATIYFNKPGIARAEFLADSIFCESLAQGINPPTLVQPYAANPYAAGFGAFLAGMMRSRDKRAMVDNVLRTCMADRGYRRIKASAAARKSLDGLADDPKIDRLAELSAAAIPDGEMLPR